MSEKSPTIGVGGVTDRLIRRLRVSDPPERFQRRAASAAREALGVEAVAWVPDSSREPVVVSGQGAIVLGRQGRHSARDDHGLFSDIGPSAISRANVPRVPTLVGE